MKVLMCCSDLSYKGGMVSVVKGYLDYPDNGDVEFIFIPTHCSGGKLALARCFAAACLRILRLARQDGIDVAHLHVSERGSFVRKGLLLRMLRRFGIPVILHHHGAEFESYYASASPGHKRFIERTLALADVNIVLSRRLIDMVKGKVPEAKVEVLYNAVPVPEVNPYSTSSSDILFLGRIGARKGAYDLLKAIRRLDSVLPPGVRLCLCGDGETARMEALVREYGLGHRVAHIGWVNGTEKERILRNTMINVLPSYHEGLPMTILETMSRGIPNISTRIASIPEVITDGETGILIEPGDVEALTASLHRLATDPGERARISLASHSLISGDFSLSTAFARLRRIYGSLTGR